MIISIVAAIEVRDVDPETVERLMCGAIEHLDDVRVIVFDAEVEDG